MLLSFGLFVNIKSGNVIYCCVLCHFLNITQQKKKGCCNLSEDLGKKIKTLRKTRGLSQEDLAFKLNLQRSTISNYEIGRRTPHLKELEKIAAILGVGLDYFGIEKEKNVYDLVSRAKLVFEDEEIPSDEKANVYKEIMRLYLDLHE